MCPFEPLNPSVNLKSLVETLIYLSISHNGSSNHIQWHRRRLHCGRNLRFRHRFCSGFRWSTSTCTGNGCRIGAFVRHLRRCDLSSLVLAAMALFKH
ncbi:unnamed protein product, partial [Vitis vinifera]